MKLFIVSLLMILLIPINAISGPGMLMQAGSGMGGGYSEHLMFLWDSPSSTTVDYSAGDSVGSLQGTASITGGSVVSVDALDYYGFDPSSKDIIDAGGTGTYFQRVKWVGTPTNGGGPFSVDHDAQDYLRSSVWVGTIFRVAWRDTARAEHYIQITGLSTDTWYWIRVAWQDSSPYVTLQIYNDSSGSIGTSIDSETDTTNDWDFIDAMDANDLKVGGDVLSAAGVFHTSYIAIYDDVRTAEP